MPSKNARGFTLLEILVALAILGTAMLAVVKTSSTNTNGIEHLRNKTLAHWVASNQLIAFELENPWPTLGKKSGKATQGGHEWFWTAEIISLPDNNNLRRVDIRVFLDEKDKDSITTLSGALLSPSVKP